MAENEDAAPQELNIAADKVCYIIIKAREFDVKVAPVNPDPGSNPADDGETEILEDQAGDPTAIELRAAINGLNDDEIVDLLALSWIGRGDFTSDAWSEARRLAGERHRRHSARYLMGMPMLGDYLEEGLSALGHSCAEFEIDRL